MRFMIHHHLPLTTHQKRQRLLIRCLLLAGGFFLVVLLHPSIVGVETSPPSNSSHVGYGGAYSSATKALGASSSSVVPETGGSATSQASSSSQSGSSGTSKQGQPANTPPPCSRSDYPYVCTSSTTQSNLLSNANNGGGSGWLQSALQGIWHATLGGWVDGVQSMLDTLDSLDLIQQTPGPLTYGNKVVTNTEWYMVYTADAALVLFLIIGGYQYMLGHYQSFRELAPRLIMAVIAAHFCLPILTQFILLLNTLCKGVTDILTGAGLGFHYPPTGFEWASAADYWIVAFLIETLCMLLLSLQMLTRIALLDLCIILAPLGLLCFALPQTQAWGRLWAQAFVSTLIVQWLQLLCLALGSALIAAFGHANGFNPIAILVGIPVLFLAAKLPDMLLSNVLRASKDTGKAMIEAVKTGVEMAAVL